MSQSDPDNSASALVDQNKSGVGSPPDQPPPPNPQQWGINLPDGQHSEGAADPGVDILVSD